MATIQPEAYGAVYPVQAAYSTQHDPARFDGYEMAIAATVGQPERSASERLFGVGATAVHGYEQQVGRIMRANTPASDQVFRLLPGSAGPGAGWVDL